ncbi:MAG: phytoene desaturase family protein [Xanthomonadales bacterium]|nr:phytoene desaturase family protein [Xanthomonadales bacterium]
MSSSRSTAVVVGAGLGGMAAALRARAKGYEVTVVDRCPRAGGRAQVFERDGFRHDAGPTVLTAPHLFDELFELFGRNRQDYVEFVPVDPWYRFSFADGTCFDYGEDLDDTLAQIERFNPADRSGYLALLEHSRRLYEIGYEQLGSVSFHRFATMVRQIPALARLRADRSVWQLVCRHLEDPRLRRAFSIQPLLVGGNPFDTTSIYSLIHFLERRWGVWFARGGTGALVDALCRLMREVGIEIELGRTVERIETKDKAVKAVHTECGQRYEADVVIANTDPAHLYGRLLPAGDVRTPARIKQRSARYSMGLFVLYFGTTRRYDDVAHHTIVLGDRYRSLLDDIFRRGVLSDDFSLYLHRPTATDNSFAPPGCDSFYVLCPVPNLASSVDWALDGPRLKQRIVSALEKRLMPGLSEAMTADFFMTPQDFASDYLSEYGAGFSISPLFRQSAWFRFHNRAEGPRGLFLVGAGTHPGAGLPGVVTSAKVVERLLPKPTGAGRAESAIQAAAG